MRPLGGESRVNRIVIVAAGIAACVGLAGCQEQRTVVVEQQAQSAGGVAPVARPQFAVHYSPCAAPRGTGPFEPLTPPVHVESIPKPQRALAEHVNGCAGVRFRIGRDGIPQDIQVMADYPAGYGFGDAVRQMVATSRWTPRDDLAWHYAVKNIYTVQPQ